MDRQTIGIILFLVCLLAGVGLWLRTDLHIYAALFMIVGAVGVLVMFLLKAKARR